MGMIDRKKLIEQLETDTMATNTGYVEVPLFQFSEILALLKEYGKTGHWIYKKDDGVFMCSCCEKHSIRNDYPYCHWCGAKMKGR